MPHVKTLVCLFALVFFAAGGANAGVVKIQAWPAFDDPDLTKPGEVDGKPANWSVWECPKAAECKVRIEVTVAQGVCKVGTWDIIDKNPHQTPQTIVWTILNNSAVDYDVEFINDGILVTENGDDVESRPADRKKDSHKKKIKKKTRSSAVLYNIQVGYKKAGSTDKPVPCLPEKGPAIVNRG